MDTNGKLEIEGKYKCAKCGKMRGIVWVNGEKNICMKCIYDKREKPLMV